MKKDFKRLFTILPASVIGYVLAFLVLFYYFRQGMSISALIPVLAAAGAFGMFPGIIAGLLSFPLNYCMHVVLGLDFWDLFIVRGAGLQGTLGLLFIGAIVGHARDLGVKLKIHRDNLDATIQEKTSELTKANKRLKAREQELQALNQQLKAGEREILKSKKFLENIFQTTGTGIFVTNEEGRIIRANRYSLKLFGFTEKEFLGKHVIDISLKTLSPDETNPVMERLFENGFVENYETICKRKDGSIFNVELNITALKDENEEVIGVVGSVRDVSSRKTAEEEIKKTKEQLENIIENSLDSIVVSDSKGRITKMNKTFLNLLGYKEEELLGKTPSVFALYEKGEYEITSGETVTITDAYFEEGLATMKKFFEQGKVVNWEYYFLRKDGKLVPIEENVVFLQDDQGNRLGSIAVIRDITERVRLENDQKKLAAQLQRAQKMEAIGTLAGGIAHDFNNILAAIMGYTEISLENLPEQNQVKKNMERVLLSAIRAKELVKQILAFSRQTNQERRPVKVRLLAQEALKLLRASIPTTIDIKYNLETESHIMADPTQIHQIVMNLCTNAIHAMPEKGTLELTLTDSDIEATAAPRYPDLAPGPYVKLTVTDAGTGMDPKIIDRIFDPYFTTKELGKGTGMGLSVVHGIVSSHGGTITVDSELGKGSTFSVYLPKAGRETEKATESLKPMPTGRESILFIDDEELLIDMGQKIIASLGYTVISKKSSMEALDEFRKDPYKFDLVITDYTMPQMTGYELAKKLLCVRSNIPIILCSGFSESISADKAKKAGIREFLIKPINRQQIAETIRRVLDQKKI